MPRALLLESPGLPYAGVFWLGFIPDKFSPGVRTLYAREYSGVYGQIGDSCDVRHWRNHDLAAAQLQ